MSGGAITGNETEVHGGGVYNNGTFTMSGGEITHNKSEKYGGGVRHASQVSFKMSGTAKITNNTAISDGGGVIVEKGRAITLGGAVEITGNKVGDNRDNNLYLGQETTVQTDSLTGKETIGVTAYDTPTDDSPVTITSDVASAGCFFSDNIHSAVLSVCIGIIISHEKGIGKGKTENGRQKKNRAIERNLAIKSKVKGLGQAFFPKGLRASRGQSHLVAVRRQRNLFACGINDKIVSRLTNKS